jgi:hypothetical protein
MTARSDDGEEALVWTKINELKAFFVCNYALVTIRN